MKSPKSLYFVHPLVDFLCMGGLSLSAFVGLSLAFGGESSSLALTVSVAMQVIVNWPHFSATNFRLYRTRENTAQYPLTAYLIPVVVFLGIVFALIFPEDLAPYFVKMFMVWSPYHFSAQTVGLTLLYARRGGIPMEGWVRWGVSSYIFGTYFVSTLRGETTSSTSSYYGIVYPGFGVPEWSVTLAEVWMVLGGLLFLAYAGHWSYRNRRVFPWIILLPAVAQSCWFLWGYLTPSFYVFVPMFHSLQYLLIAWVMQLSEKSMETRQRKTLVSIWKESGAWILLNIAGGGVLFFVIPKAVNGLGVSMALATGVVIAGVQMHHFIVDGVIWKLRNPTVSSPLMVSFSELQNNETPRRREAA